MGVMHPVRDSPAMVGHQDGGVCDIAHQVVDLFAVGEALVPAAHNRKLCLDMDDTHVPQVLHATTRPNASITALNGDGWRQLCVGTTSWLAAWR